MVRAPALPVHVLQDLALQVLAVEMDAAAEAVLAVAAHQVADRIKHRTTSLINQNEMVSAPHWPFRFHLHTYIR